MGLFDLRHPFFRPVWRRWLVIAFCLGWAVFEFVTASPFWGMIFAAIGVTAIWQFLLTPWPEDDSEEH